MTVLRRSYEESCQALQGVFLAADEIPPLADRLPRHDDGEPLGVSFFRTFVGEGIDLSNLTLPRTFFGRSEINDVAFVNTDMTESNLCWNDFIHVDFTRAGLSGADLRASLFSDVKFIAADLSNADMRQSSFEACDFTGAQMNAAILTREQGKNLSLSEAQRAAVAWTDDEGPEPEGG